MLFIETSTSTKLLPNYLTDEEYRGLQTCLLQKPGAGDLIKGSGGSLRTNELSEPSPPKVIGLKLHMSQSAFAGLMGVSVRTLQDWEQGRREPQGPAIALLRIAEQHPEVFSQLH